MSMLIAGAPKIANIGKKYINKSKEKFLNNLFLL